MLTQTHTHTHYTHTYARIILLNLRTTEISSFLYDISIIKWLKWEETKTPRDFFSKINTTRSKPKSNRIFVNFYIFFWQKTNNATVIELSSSIIWLYLLFCFQISSVADNTTWVLGNFSIHSYHCARWNDSSINYTTHVLEKII